ncbi:MAG: DUF58 domain-containing protein [Planctomycetales bacterium]|nr:DUF58 domain-containing protein [Planctomycetales bacterium]NIM08234.1 DUF58 domain-containing protein [Planctomycetales bacterium]NIN07728.1 DUF58 domain-containing protein [Planctomycetales bacterium]NIN76854.1 DUF58 domain-containing protein [Planctomycetales bacterium]NIO34050.1 DUF58 domain-containing protein [Planctomycetales bacterium]
MPVSVEKYLKPEVIRQIARLDLRAQFIVKGFLQGLHASPYHGFSVEFSEHRKYTPGDNPDDIDWLVYAKTDKYYIKKFEAETNIHGYLVMDLSRSMAYTYRQQLTKFEYSICLAAAMAYLMIHQQDPVGLITFDRKIRDSLAPKSKRKQLGNILSLLSRLEPQGETDIARSITQIAAMLKHRSLVMLFTDLFAETESVLRALHRLRHGGHDVILFHVLDEAELRFPFEGMVEFEEPETGEKLQVDATDFRPEYLAEIAAFRDRYHQECLTSGVDYVPLDTSMQFDRALTEYLAQRKTRF